MRFQDDEQGASLIEQLIAIALMGVVLVSLLYALSGGTLGVGVVDERVTSSRLATTALESVRQIGYVTDTLSYTPALPVPPGYVVQVSASTLVTGLQLITATVYHNNRPIWRQATSRLHR